ncbi:uncharacterized protein LOC131604168 [Vicia villosa]|uniref:uncharacterized protein LOC131604168 n=1 Tax=Vicia villosa TaxID=3911 RepID=UPI00273BCAF2|nr:uncharacterized protein LOC131604168 [Vicia villosa]
MAAVGEFLREVEVAFHDDREKYDQFCKLWEDLQFGRIHYLFFEEKLTSLFEGHKHLILEFNKLLPKHVSDFFEAVKVTLKDDYHDFIKVVADYMNRKIDERCLSSRVEVLLRRHEHADLISQISTFLSAQCHATFPRWDELPFDVLDVISRKLDFADLFQFSRVCTNWRVVHKSIDQSKFLTSQEPLLVEVLKSPVKVPYSCISLPKQKVYPLNKMMMNMLSYSGDSFPIYVSCSCGYFVIIADNSSLLLINPFTRIKKKSNSLHVYQSRNNGWVTCSTDYPHDIGNLVHNFIDDFVALNNIIYVVTSEARIGVLNLNSANIEFFKMANSHNLKKLELQRSSFNLVKCDDELFLVRLNPDLTRGSFSPPERKVFKIDFSTMTYVELETLGNIALFYACFKSCKALSNPNKWGYENNSVYQVCSHLPHQITNCTVYNWDKKSEKYIAPPNLRTKGSSILDWCFII